VSAVLPGDELTASGNPLTRPLDDVEYAVLQTIWDPVASAASGVGAWPVWDYVSRTMFQREPPVPDADSVFWALPAVPRGLQLGRYGLVWNSQGHYSLEPGKAVGLTIAGIWRLSERRPGLRSAADRLAALIGALAKTERQLVPLPDREVDDYHPMAASLDALSRRTLDEPVALNPDAVCELLRREYTLLYFQESSTAGKSVRLSTGLRPFLGVESAADYVDRIGRAHPVQLPQPSCVASSLPRVIDHLSYVLRSDKDWTGDPLVLSPDLETPSGISAGVTTPEDFRNAMSALAQVIENLNAPQVPAQELAKYDNRQPKSISRLAEWLGRRLQDEESRARVTEAIAVLRSAISLRVEGQHTNTNARKAAQQARARLGLPDPIRDWPAAWDLVRARLADAFEVIRREVQLVARS
jgi:ribosomal protein S13